MITRPSRTRRIDIRPRHAIQNARFVSRLSIASEFVRAGPRFFSPVRQPPPVSYHDHARRGRVGPFLSIEKPRREPAWLSTGLSDRRLLREPGEAPTRRLLDLDDYLFG